ncbi:MAG: hypothetical protein SFX18_01090 [Pirellulales bacterium]|nr:hypothetical protein [Pirellulales bacterium]
MRAIFLGCLMAGLLALGWPGALFAGGGPENVFVVVNNRSADSISLANHYIALRQIPPGNVLYLDIDQTEGTIDILDFRKKILLPTLQMMQTRGLTAQIDIIAYSSGFPWVVDFRADVPGGASAKGRFSASLTALTFLRNDVLARRMELFQDLNSNLYFRKQLTGGNLQPSLGFRSWYGWGNKGELLENGGEHYVLCVALGVTATRDAPGNTLAEAVNVLTRSAAADGTRPGGTHYFSDHADVRARTRAPYFGVVAKELQAMNQKVEIIKDLFPREKPDIAGGVLGFPTFNVAASGSTILPGAVVENLTSFGGRFDKGHGQTLLTEFLRAGASGSSGTVDEPNAIAQKFPHPQLHVHYARGCNLAESFYQSVQGPYQLLIVGDPLCAPWGVVPQVDVTLAGAEGEAGAALTGQPLQGTIELIPTAVAGAGGAAVDRFELFVDGARVGRCGAGEKLTLNTAQYPDGYHELRVVGLTATLIETQGRKVINAPFVNSNRKLTAKLAATTVAAGKPISIQVTAPGARNLLAYSNGRILAQAVGGQTTFNIPTTAKTILGTGPVTLRVMAMGDSGTTSNVISPPLTVTIGE